MGLEDYGAGRDFLQKWGHRITYCGFSCIDVVVDLEEVYGFLDGYYLYGGGGGVGG